jgi:integrase
LASIPAGQSTRLPPVHEDLLPPPHAIPGKRSLWRRDELESWVVSGCPSRQQMGCNEESRLILPLRPETAVELQAFFAGKLPTAKAFGGRYKRLTDKTAPMIRADLAEAGIGYTDPAGRFRDFHALRHTTGSWLAANGVHPKVAQAIMRHSDINLTMSRYTHLFRG